jgi:hypothetical protein
MNETKIGAPVALRSTGPFAVYGRVVEIIERGDERPRLLVLDTGLRFDEDVTMAHRHGHDCGC